MFAYNVELSRYNSALKYSFITLPVRHERKRKTHKIFVSLSDETLSETQTTTCYK